MTTVEILKEIAFTATETQRRALEDAISALSESKEDAVSRGTLEQIMWERDTAIQQLKDLGYSLGEKPKKGDLINRQAVLATLDNMDKALDEERTVEKYKELLAECIKVLPPVQPVIPNMTITVNDSYMRNVRRDCGLYE